MKGNRVDRLTADRAREVLDYDPDTGVFTWKVRTGPACKIGSPAGCLDKNGYLKIKIDREQHYGHRLAFLIVLGYMPIEVDHEDLNRSNNKWLNLRPAVPLEQMRNRDMPKNNTSGVKGVRREGGGWRARIRVDGKKLHLGTFKSIEEAATAYNEAATRYFGEFARLNSIKMLEQE